LLASLTYHAVLYADACGQNDCLSERIQAKMTAFLDTDRAIAKPPPQAA